MEEREKLHKETVERLQTQVRGGSSTPCGFTLQRLPSSCLYSFTLFISDSAAGEESARKKDPFCRPVSYR